MMSLVQCVAKLTMAGSLVSCAHVFDDRGGAPLVDNAELHMDQRVTVVGEVDEVRGEQTFTLTNNGLTGDEHLLVIATQPVRQITMGNAVVFRGERVQVYGMVRRLSPALERRYGLALAPDLAVQYDNRPVVVTAWISPPRGRNAGALAKR